jgi:hypothetical protein
MQEMTKRISIELERLGFEHHDYCTSCGYEFQNGDTSHLGYDKNDKPLYVCDNCKYLLKETAIRYYYLKRPYEIPVSNSFLWRYIDFTKYVSMINKKCLFFARADQFDDPFEGAKGIINNKQRWDEYYLEFFKSAIKNPPIGKCNLTETEIDIEAKRLLNETEQGGVKEREITFINCWHENTVESEAMWKLYSNFMDNALAVKTTYKRLYESLGKDPHINIGRVKYIDMKQQYAGINAAYWRKRKSFEHEMEVRAIVVDFQCKDKGKELLCDLNLLIEAIYVSPTSPDWFIHLLKDVNNKYGYDFEIKKSDLLLSPFY